MDKLRVIQLSFQLIHDESSLFIVNDRFISIHKSTHTSAGNKRASCIIVLNGETCDLALGYLIIHYLLTLDSPGNLKAS
jgi:hypothetical protein